MGCHTLIRDLRNLTISFGNGFGRKVSLGPDIKLYSPIFIL